MSINGYWFANFSLDFIKFLPFAILCPGIIYLTDTQEMIKDGNGLFFILLCLLYGLSIINFAYAISFKYDTSYDA
jgi:hypothetical protein